MCHGSYMVYGIIYGHHVIHPIVGSLLMDIYIYLLINAPYSKLSILAVRSDPCLRWLFRRSFQRLRWDTAITTVTHILHTEVRHGLLLNRSL